MKTISVFIALTLTCLTSFADEQCNWGPAAPKQYRCNGQTYIKALIACRSGIYSGAFCNERHVNDGKACAQDVDPETMKCHQKLFSVKDDGTETESAESKPAKRIPISPGWPKPGSEKTESKPVKRIPILPGWPKPAEKAQETASSKPPAPQDTNVDRCHWKEPGIAYYECEGETFAFGHLGCQYRGTISNLFCTTKHEKDVDACIDDNEPKTQRCLTALLGLRAKAPAKPAGTVVNGTVR